MVQTIWLAATSLGMGLQFISTPQEIPEKWALVSAMLGVREGFELMLLLRPGYEDPNIRRSTIDWSSPYFSKINSTQGALGSAEHAAFVKRLAEKES